jgi:hypothetical protein
MLSHSLAIACLPFMAFGSLGLSFILQTKNRISWLALFIFCFGLIAAMVAAVINGLVLPQFIAHSVVESCNESVVKAITVYGHYFNVSMASIFIFATTASVAIWSALIIRSAHFPKWPGYLGLLLFAFEMVCLCSNLNFTDLYGFRIFVTGLAGWQIFAGICMWRARWEK